MVALLGVALVSMPAKGLFPMVDRLVFPEAPESAFRLQLPENPRPILVMDHEWEGPESGYGSLVQTADGLRLYYRGGGESTREFTCVATSPDGETWQRWSGPAKAFASIAPQGSNVVWTGDAPSYRESHNFLPFLDTNPRAKPAERWKAVALDIYPKQEPGRKRSLCSLVSPDGLNWKRVSEKPILTDGSFDSLNVAFFDTDLKAYVCYFREGRDGFRSVRRSTSMDFVNWSKSEWVEFPSLPKTHLYTNGIQPYPKVDGLYVAMPMRFVPSRKQIGDPPKAIDGVSDGLLLFSRDGKRFPDHFGGAWIRPGRDPANWGWAHGNNTPIAGIGVHPGWWSAYWFDHYGSVPRVLQGRIRPDGFVALTASAKTTLRSIVFQPTGSNLKINFRTSASGSVRVGLVSPEGTWLEGFGLSDGPELFGDELDREVRWGPRTLKDLEQPFRLVVEMTEAELFSIRFAR